MELYNVYINHDPGMTLTHFRQGHLSLPSMLLNGEKREMLLNGEKLTGKEQMDRIFMLIKKITPGDRLPSVL